MNNKCLNPNCENEAKSRGLCNACYSVARNLVNENITTWEELEASEKCLSRNAKRKMGKTAKWLVSNDDATTEED